MWAPVSANGTNEYLPWRFVHSTWEGLKTMPRRFAIYGNFQGKQSADELVARKALVMMLLREPEVGAVVLVRDTDDARDGDGLVRAKVGRQWPFGVAIGIAAPRVEAWFLAAFEPLNKNEEQLLSKQRQMLSFDPRTEAGRLRDRRAGNPRNPKTVVEALGGVLRGAQGLAETDWSIIYDRDRYGIASFVEDLRNTVVSLFDATPS